MTVDRLRVAGEVLDRRGNLERGAAGALHAHDVGPADRRRQRRLLRPCLVVATPAVVAREILDWSEVPERSSRPKLLLCGGTRSPRERAVPGGAQADRLREQGCLERMAEAVHGV